MTLNQSPWWNMTNHCGVGLVYKEFEEKDVSNLPLASGSTDAFRCFCFHPVENIFNRFPIEDFFLVSWKRDFKWIEMMYTGCRQWAHASSNQRMIKSLPELASSFCVNEIWIWSRSGSCVIQRCNVPVSTPLFGFTVLK